MSCRCCVMNKGCGIIIGADVKPTSTSLTDRTCWQSSGLPHGHTAALLTQTVHDEHKRSHNISDNEADRNHKWHVHVHPDSGFRDKQTGSAGLRRLTKDKLNLVIAYALQLNLKQHKPPRPKTTSWIVSNVTPAPVTKESQMLLIYLL